MSIETYVMCEDDGLVFMDAPGPDIIADPTGRSGGTVRIGDIDDFHMKPGAARRFAHAVLEAADIAEGVATDGE